jgi:type III restriction enzyme
VTKKRLTRGQGLRYFPSYQEPFRTDTMHLGVHRITLKHKDTTRIKVIPDAYNPIGSTMHVKFNTSKKDRWETDARRCHINYVILDSDWEAEFCRVAESHPRVKAYVKNHNLGLEVPYRYGSENRKYRPDFIVLVDDGHGEEDPIHMIVEIKGYRREDAKRQTSSISQLR